MHIHPQLKFILVAMLIFNLPTTALAVQLSGSQIGSGRSFKATNVEITSFYGVVEVKDLLKKNEVYLELDGKKTDLDNISITYEGELLKIDGNANGFLELKIYMSADLPISMHLSSSKLKLAARNAATSLELNSTNGSIDSSSKELVCILQGNSTLSINQLIGDASFKIYDLSRVVVQNGKVNNLDLSIYNKGFFSLTGTVTKNLNYSIYNFGIAQLQDVKGAVLKGHLSAEGKLFINMVEQK